LKNQLLDAVGRSVESFKKLDDFHRKTPAELEMTDPRYWVGAGLFIKALADMIVAFRDGDNWLKSQ